MRHGQSLLIILILKEYLLAEETGLSIMNLDTHPLIIIIIAVISLFMGFFNQFYLFIFAGAILFLVAQFISVLRH